MKKLLAAGGFFLLLFLAGAVWAFVRFQAPVPVPQPIAFDHQRHMKEEMSCTDCHAQVEKSPHAGFPMVQQCMLCHGEAQGTHPDEPKVREAADSGGQIAWQQVNRLPGHVYFSHAAHTKFAKMDCKECHGDMSQMTEPVISPQILHLDMGRCMACHQEKNAWNECITCHK